MNLTHFNMLEQHADWVLASFRGRYGFPDRPPVPVEMIAQALGLTLEFGKLGRMGSRTLGVLIVSERKVYLDERCSWHQRTFAIAHEVGHWFLHEGRHCLQLPTRGLPEPMSCDGVISRARRPTKRQEAELCETDANRFAAALLIPRSFLARSTKRYRVIDAGAMMELAAEFQVSLQTMRYRIRDLTKHLAWDGPSVDETRAGWCESPAKRPRSDTQSGGEPPLPLRSGAQAPTTPNTGRVHARADKTRPAQQGRGLGNCPCQTKQDVAMDPLATQPHLGHPADASHCKQGAPLASGKYLRRQNRPQDRRQSSKHPYVIEFAGTPNAGKDTLAEIIKGYLEDGFGLKVRVFDEGIKSCHLDKSLDVDRLYKTVALAVVQLYEARFENPGDYDFVIFNRGLFDRLAFLHEAMLENRITEEQEHVHVAYVLSYARLVDDVFLLIVPPHESLKRERMSASGVIAKLLEGDNILPQSRSIVNEKAIALLNTSYAHVYHDYAKYFRRIHALGLAGGPSIGVVETARALIGLLPVTGRTPTTLLFDKCLPSLEQHGRARAMACRVSSPSAKPEEPHLVPVQLCLPL